MSRKVKAVLISQIAGALSGADNVLVLNVSKMSGNDINRMRREMSSCSLVALGVKSDLAAVACDRSSRSGLTQALRGASTLVYGGTDLFELCRDVKRIASEYGCTVVGGLSLQVAIDEHEISTIASGPSRRQWLEQIVLLIASPGQQLSTLMSSPSGVLVSQLDSLAIEPS